MPRHHYGAMPQPSLRRARGQRGEVSVPTHCSEAHGGPRRICSPPSERARGRPHASEVRYEGKGVSATDCSPPARPSRGMCGSCSAPLKPQRGRVGAEEARVGHGKSSSQAPPLLLAMGIEGKHFQSSDKNTSLAVSVGLRAEPAGSGLVAHRH